MKKKKRSKLQSFAIFVEAPTKEVLQKAIEFKFLPMRLSILAIESVRRNIKRSTLSKHSVLSLLHHFLFDAFRSRAISYGP